MKIIFLTLVIILTCFSCGKKGDPEYKTHYYENNLKNNEFYPT